MYNCIVLNLSQPSQQSSRMIQNTNHTHAHTRTPLNRMIRIQEFAAQRNCFDFIFTHYLFLIADWAGHHRATPGGIYIPGDFIPVNSDCKGLTDDRRMADPIRVIHYLRFATRYRKCSVPCSDHLRRREGEVSPRRQC